MLHKLDPITISRIKAQQVITGIVASVKELLEYQYFIFIFIFSIILFRFDTAHKFH